VCAAREAEEKEGRRRSTSFFLPCLRFLCTQEFGGHFFFAFAHFLLYTKDPDLLQALDSPVMPASAAPARRWRWRRRWRRRLCLLLLKAKVTLKLTWRRRRGRRRYSRSRGSKAFFIDSPPPAAFATTPASSGNKGFSKPPPRPWPRSTTGPNVKTRQKLD
jgi:hypothetical protein